MNATKLAFGFLLSAALLAGSAPSSQAVVTVIYDPGTTQVTTALTGFSTSGDMMDGMAVTAFFVGGGSETVFWADTGAGAGAAIGTGWSLAESGDTFTSTWRLSNVSAGGIDRLFIDAGVGDTVFDTILGVNGTDGSAQGREFTLLTFTGLGDIDVTYKDQVALTGDAPVGDLWRLMTIDFLALDGLTRDQLLDYQQDTDNLSIAGDIRPAVPEPATVGLSLLGLVGLGASVLRRRA